MQNVGYGRGSRCRPEIQFKGRSHTKRTKETTDPRKVGSIQGKTHVDLQKSFVAQVQGMLREIPDTERESPLNRRVLEQAR